MTRLLWITDEPPDRGRGGGSIRQAHLVHALSGRFDITLVTASHVDDDEVRRDVRRLITVAADPRPPGLVAQVASPYPSDVAATRPVRAALARAALPLEADADVVVVEHAWVLPILPRRRRVPWTGTLHYLPSSRAEQWKAVAPDPLRRLRRTWDVARARRLERWAVSHYDRIFTVSPADAAALGASVVIPNGVDLEAFPPSPVPADARVVLTASLDYGPNVDGLAWFLSEVFPLVQDGCPDVALDVVGRQPTDEVRRLVARPGVALHPDVPAVAPFLQRARVAVVPLRVGSGTRLKALEAMASNRPVVGTTVGLEGLGLTDGTDCRMADDAPAFAASVLDLLTDDDEAVRLAESARDRAAAAFGWDAIGDRLADALGAVL